MYLFLLTAKEHVMYDYGKKMFEGWKRTQSLQRKCLELLMGVPKGSLESDIIRDNYQDLPFPLPLDVGSGSSVVVVFNSLANDVIEAVTFNVDDPRMVHDLCIVDTQRPQDTIAHQVWSLTLFPCLSVLALRMQKLSFWKFTND